MKNKNIVLTNSLLLLLLINSLPLSAQIQSRRIPVLTPQQIIVLRERGQAVRQVRRMLLDYGVPFEPYLLFSASWSRRLSSAFNRFSAMQSDIDQTTRELNGVRIANRLTLPGDISLTGDTVIVARSVLLRGQHVRIAGPYSLHIFAVDSFRTSIPGGSITIDTSGRGRQEWIESKSRELMVAQRQTAFLRSSFASRISTSQSGQPGADGTHGQAGTPGNAGNAGGNGAHGACGGNRNGANGTAGASGGSGGDGWDGGNGGNGGNGQAVTLTITNPSDTTSYTLTSRGGNGGFGGNGGIGGSGGRGGDGGIGGNGASCSCEEHGGVGNGGNGGNGASGGYGGDGGAGGNGGNGGVGGLVTVNYPQGYNTNYVTINNGGGAAGGAGNAGQGAQGGQGGNGGNPGQGGSLSSCSGNNGTSGSGGGNGGSGSGGGGGNGGSAGNAGNVVWTVVGGGGSGGEMIPGGTGTGGCTEWYWVEFECYPLNERPRYGDVFYSSLTMNLQPYLNRSDLARSFSIANAADRPVNGTTTEEWECYVVSSTYLGCW